MSVHLGGSSSMTAVPGVLGGSGGCTGVISPAGEAEGALASLGLSTLGDGAAKRIMSSKQLSRAVSPFSSLSPAPSRQASTRGVLLISHNAFPACHNGDSLQRIGLQEISLQGISKCLPLLRPST